MEKQKVGSWKTKKNRGGGGEWGGAGRDRGGWVGGMGGGRGVGNRGATAKHDHTFFGLDVGESVLAGHVPLMSRGLSKHEALPGDMSAVFRSSAEKWPELAAPSTALQVDGGKLAAL